MKWQSIALNYLDADTASNVFRHTKDIRSLSFSFQLLVSIIDVFRQGLQVILEGVVDVTAHGSQSRQVIFTDGSRQKPGEEDLEESGEGTSQISLKFVIRDFVLALGDVSVKTVGSVVNETNIRPLGVVDDGVGSRTVPDDDLEALRKQVLGFDGLGEALHVGSGGVSHFISPLLDASVS